MPGNSGGVSTVKECIETKKAPAAIGPYSQGIKAGQLIFTSGQLPMDPTTGELVGGGMEEQAERALENMKAVLESAGASMGGVVKVTVFLKDMGDFADMNQVYSKYFSENPPARSCVQVTKLPKDVRIEIEAVAVLGSQEIRKHEGE